MTFAQAEAFCEGLSTHDPAYAFRLPTEVEWEVACRGTRPPEDGPLILGPWEPSSRPTGDWKPVFWKYAVCDAFEEGVNHPEPVGSRAPNPLGLHDMHGNVHEWCTRSEPPFGYPDVFKAPIRGGAYDSAHTACRASTRSFQRPDQPTATIGFRVVATRRRGE
jgi:formylglycine-generating enzyme required for sulfatase activity